LRYAYGIPAIDGIGSLTARFDGQGPGILLNCSALAALQKPDSATAAVIFRYRLEENGEMSCDVSSSWHTDKPLIQAIGKIIVGGRKIETLYSPPISFSVESHGGSFDRLETNIYIVDSADRKLHLSGEYEMRNGVYS